MSDHFTKPSIVISYQLYANLCSLCTAAIEHGGLMMGNELIAELREELDQANRQRVANALSELTPVDVCPKCRAVFDQGVSMCPTCNAATRVDFETRSGVSVEEMLEGLKLDDDERDLSTPKRIVDNLLMRLDAGEQEKVIQHWIEARKESERDWAEATALLERLKE